MVKIIYKKGLIILNQVEFDAYTEREVFKNNDTSGKITLPKNWIGKKVYVMIKGVKKK